MASTPHTETRSPLTLLDKIPKEHEKAIKQAFYNTAANIFLCLAFATVLAVYFILEAFLKPLLWAVLCGAFLYPFKRSLTGVLRNWLKGLHDSQTPFLVGLVITPIKCVDDLIEGTCTRVFQNLKLVAAVVAGIPAVYVLWHFGPLRSFVEIVQGIFFFTYDLLGYFTSFWIWTLAIAYLCAIIFIWNQESQSILKALSIPLWLLLIMHIAATAGILRVPLLILMGVGVTMGFLAEQNEIRRQQKEGRDPNRKSVFESVLSKIMGEHPTPEQSPTDEAVQSEPVTAQDIPVETIPTPIKTTITKPNTLHVGSPRKPHIPSKLTMSPTPEGPVPMNHSLSDQCFIGLFWAHVLSRVFLNFWLVIIFLPILAIWGFKKIGLKLWSDEGPMGDKVKVIRQSLGNWIRERKDVLMPKWLRGVARLVLKGDQKIISILESSLDSATSVLFILLLLIGGVVFSIFFAVQVQQESMYLVKTTSNLLNETLHPEMANWLPNNQDVQEAMDSMVGNAYVYGRNWIASKVRDLVNGPSDNNTQIEKQVLDLWDRLYDAWLSRNATSTSVAKPESNWMPIDMSNLTSIWDVATQTSGFNFGDIVPFVKENIGTFLSVLESIWLVLKGNMSLVMTVLTSTLSMVLGGGTALLNFVLSSIIFLTTLFYLLASSGDQYKPIEIFTRMSPPSAGGNTFGQAVQDAVGGVFMASLKMGTFYGLYTWLTHLLFGVNIVFIPSALAAVFGAIPFVGTYLAAVPGVIELWLVHDQFLLAVLLLVCHFLPMSVVDTAIYSEIKGGHPYMTGLAIAGGMYWLGLEGAIFGPIILCVLVVLVNVYTSMMKPETPSFLRSQSVI